MSISPDNMMARGLTIIGYTPNRQARVRRAENLERFKTDFGKDPRVLVKVWVAIQQFPIENKLENASQLDLDVFLWTFHWLTDYCKEKSLERLTGWCDKTVRSRLKLMVHRIAALKEHVIIWPAAWNTPSANTPTYLVSVDGTHCPIHEPTLGHPFSKNTRYYSHKFQRSALAYEVALDIFTNRIVWINGPFPAGTHDPDIFVLPNGLRSRIPAGKRVVADSAYRRNAILDVVSVPNNADTREVCLFKRRVRARQETIFLRMKKFDVLTTNFRHGEAYHKVVFHAVAAICHFELEYFPLFDP